MPSQILLKEIFDRYTERCYPKFAALVSVSLPESWLNKEELPILEQKLSDSPPISVQPTPLEAPSSKHLAIMESNEASAPKKHLSWERVALQPDFSYLEILNISYNSLHHALKSPPTVPCAIEVSEEDREEVFFFNRLAKILCKQLFPTRLVYREQELTQSPHDLILLPLSRIQTKFPQAAYHCLLTYKGRAWLPIYSSACYEEDIQLKRDLWSILNQQPFAYTQKSS